MKRKRSLVLDEDDERAVELFTDLGKESFDAIIHLAASVPSSFHRTDTMHSLSENFNSTLNILTFFEKMDIDRFIFASSSSVFGQTQYLPVDESHPLNPDNFYSIGKLVGEMLCNQFKLETEKKITSLRLSAPYGPGQKENSVIPIFIKKALNSNDIPIHGTGKRSQDFIYITDIVDAFMSALHSDHSGVYNIGSGQSTSTLNLAKIILKNCPKTNSKIIFSEKIDPQESYRMKMNISKGKKELDYSPKILIEDGIKKYIDYLLKSRSKTQ